MHSFRSCTRCSRAERLFTLNGLPAMATTMMHHQRPASSLGGATPGRSGASFVLHPPAAAHRESSRAPQLQRWSPALQHHSVAARAAAAAVDVEPQPAQPPQPHDAAAAPALPAYLRRNGALDEYGRAMLKNLTLQELQEWCTAQGEDETCPERVRCLPRPRSLRRLWDLKKPTLGDTTTAQVSRRAAPVSWPRLFTATGGGCAT